MFQLPGWISEHEFGYNEVICNFCLPFKNMRRGYENIHKFDI